jgi:hypothetical protein
MPAYIQVAAEAELHPLAGPPPELSDASPCCGGRGLLCGEGQEVCWGARQPRRRAVSISMSRCRVLYFCDKWRRGSYRRIALTLIELHADRHQNSCWLHSCEAADFVIDCVAKLPAQLIITCGSWKSRCGRVRGGPSRRAGGDWRLPRYALPRPTDEALHGRDLHRLCYHDSQSWLGGWWRGGAAERINPLRARKVSPVEQPGAHPQDATSPKKKQEKVTRKARRRRR